jgi:hypothetical protein
VYVMIGLRNWDDSFRGSFFLSLCIDKLGFVWFGSFFYVKST